MTIATLKGDHAIHDEMGPDDIDFVTDMGLGVARLREDIDTLACPIPIISGIGKVQVCVPHLDVIIHGGSGLYVAGEADHVLPRLYVHIPHMNVIRRKEVFKRIGGLARAIGWI